jgi:hypothetical protein
MEAHSAPRFSWHAFFSTPTKGFDLTANVWVVFVVFNTENASNSLFAFLSNLVKFIKYAVGFESSSNKRFLSRKACCNAFSICSGHGAGRPKLVRLAIVFVVSFQIQNT